MIKKTAEKRIVSKIKIAQIEDLIAGCVKISRAYILYYPKNKSSKSVMVEPGDRFK